MSNARNIYDWLRDSLVAMILFLFACVFAGAVKSMIVLEYPDFYMLWYAVGAIPFYWFAVWRRAISPLNRNDIIAYGSFVAASAFIPGTLFEFHPALYALTLYLLLLIAGRIRRHLPVSPQK